MVWEAKNVPLAYCKARVGNKFMFAVSLDILLARYTARLFHLFSRNYFLFFNYFLLHFFLISFSIFLSKHPLFQFHKCYISNMFPPIHSRCVFF